MRILVDMDGTVCDFVKVVLNKYNERYNDNLTHEDITAYGMHEVVKEECGRNIYKIYHEKGTFVNCPLLPGAKESIEGFLNAGHQVIFVTKPVDFSLHCLPEKQIWVDKHFPRIGRDNIVFTSSKHLVRGDILIDDHGYNLYTFDGAKVLIDQPWNQDVNDARYGIDRVYSWKDIVSYVEKLY